MVETDISHVSVISKYYKQKQINKFEEINTRPTFWVTYLFWNTIEAIIVVDYTS